MATARPVNLEDIDKSMSKTTQLQEQYLREHGWVYTCETPGAYWLWRKLYREDVLIAPLTMALCLEQGICEAEVKI